MAIDRPCPDHYDTCLTVHVMSETRVSRDHYDMDTVRVVKSCSHRRECAQASGCGIEGGLSVCRCGYIGKMHVNLMMMTRVTYISDLAATPLTAMRMCPKVVTISTQISY